MLAQYGVGREGLPGDWPRATTTPPRPYTPAWQEAHHLASRRRRPCGSPGSSRENAEESGGRSHDPHGRRHQPLVPLRHDLPRVPRRCSTLTGCQGRNGGGWAHYVGQEKCRPVTGLGARWRCGLRLATPATADDRHRLLVPAHRPVALRHLRCRRRSPRRSGAAGFAGHEHAPTCLAKSARMGWMPSYPTFDRNPLDLADEAAAADRPVAEHVVAELQGRVHCGSPPRTPTRRRTGRGSWPSGGPTCWARPAKGNEYFLKHLLGTDTSLRAERSARDVSGRRR